MEFLKEDGSLDIERIGNLPLEEFMNVVGDLTEEQYEDFLSKLPVNESNEPMQAVVVDYTLEEDLARGTVIADDVINNIGKRYGKK